MKYFFYPKRRFVTFAPIMNNNSKSPVSDLQYQQLLLRMEYEYEKEEFKRQTETMGIARKVKRGLCWYPVSPGRSYYNSLNQLVIDITRTENKEIEHSFEFGRPVCFFHQSFDGKVKYLVNDLLMNLRGLAPLCIPINKTGKQAKDFPKMVEAGFQSDNQLIMFPAGLCSRRYNGVIRDLEWKKTFVVKSVQTKRDVIPVHFGGRNSDFFYNLANICKALGIKFNIAMLYLADEMFKNRHKTFTVTFGKPIPWQTFDKSKTPAQWAEYVKDIVYKL